MLDKVPSDLVLGDVGRAAGGGCWATRSGSGSGRVEVGLHVHVCGAITRILIKTTVAVAIDLTRRDIGSHDVESAERRSSTERVEVSSWRNRCTQKDEVYVRCQ